MYRVAGQISRKFSSVSQVLANNKAHTFKLG